jgi:hypothetical protein
MAVMLVAVCVAGSACGQFESQRATDAEIARPLWLVDAIQEPSVLELPEGAVVVAGQSRAHLLVLNANGADSTTIGRAGGAPGEFRLPTALLPINDAQFGVVDLGLRRLTVFDHGLAVNEVHPVPINHDAATAVMLSDKRWLSENHAGRMGDSVPLVESSDDSAPPRVRAMLYSPPTVFIDRGATGFNMAVEYLGRDVWGALADGTVWIARVRDNRVTWISHHGVTESAPLEYERIATVAGDLRRWRGLPAPTFADFDRPIASEKGAFQNVVATQSGELWYWLNQPDGYKSELYRCRTRDNRWGNTVRLPYGSKLLRIGARAAYVHQVTEAGDEKLGAYTVPECKAEQ